MAAATNETPTQPSDLEQSSSGINAQYVSIPRRGVNYRGKIVLAPMVRSGELPSRLLALKYGADLVWGPETIDRAMIGATRRTNPRTGCIEWIRVSSQNKSNDQDPGNQKEAVIYRVDPAREYGKLVYQIGSASPTLAVQAASMVAPYVNGIDLNSGCPKPFSVSGNMGAALLRDPDRLCSILTALVTEVGIPYEIGISVKIRLLETPEKTADLVNRLCKTGITGLTIHCRTTPMRPRERAIREQLRMIGEICRTHGVACLMNGDVTSREQGVTLAEEFGVDGAMIATAAEANSSIFRPRDQGGLALWMEVVTEYLKLAMSVENKWGNTKFLLSQLMPGKNPAYQKVQMSRSYAEVVSILEISDTDIIVKAKEMDRLLGLDIPLITKRDVKRENKQQNHESREKKKREKKKVLGQINETNAQNQQMSTERSKNQMAQIAAENAGFEGIGQGALAVAV